MAYIGPAPNPGQNREVDDISSGFNGGTAAFTLQVNGQNVSPGSANAIIISLGGVVQNPGTDYTVAGSTITFTTNPASGLSFFGLVLGQGVDTGVPSDGSVTLAKFVNGTSSNNGKFLRANNGAAPTFETVTGTTINNNADNRIITGSGTANTLEGEANLTFDGTVLQTQATAPDLRIKSSNAGLGQSDEVGRLSIHTSDPTTPSGVGEVFRLKSFSANANGADYSTELVSRAGSGGGESSIRLGQGAVGAISFSTHPSGSATERMRLNSSGVLNLGATSYSGGGSQPIMYIVGTSGRQVKIHNTNSGTCALQLSNAGTGEGDDAGLMLSSLSDGQANISNAENANLLFGTNNNTRLCIKGNGDMIFGGATSVEAQANITFEADRDDGSGRITFNRANTSSVSICIEMQNNNSQSGRIEYDNSSCGIFSSSDYRVKENDVAISDGISRVKQLRPIRFNFKAEPSKTVDGFFAHEISSIVPEAVSGEKDAVDSDGKMIIQGICKEKLVPLITAALQEAITKIETLETKVAALEAA